MRKFYVTPPQCFVIKTKCVQCMTSEEEVWKLEKQTKLQKLGSEKKKEKQGTKTIKENSKTSITNLGCAVELVDHAYSEVACSPIYCGGFLILHDSRSKVARAQLMRSCYTEVLA